MKDVPMIAPEVRGLLEEIVADPRSSIRLVPRRALRSWFDSGETARAREISTTRAEHHLIEVHREALAELLCEAAWIAYWKAPILTHRPVGQDGNLFDPAEREVPWRTRAGRRAADSRDESGVGLLRQCLTGIQSGSALALSQASLTLAPGDRTRCHVGLTLPWNQPRSAIKVFYGLSQTAQPSELRTSVLLPLAARLCASDQLMEARRVYRLHGELVPGSVYGPIYSFNLSCFLGDERSALKEATCLGALLGEGDPRLQEARTFLRQWIGTRSESELARAKSTGDGIWSDIPEVVRTLCVSQP